MMNKERKNVGISSVISVVLMVVITIAIATTVYLYVSDMQLNKDIMIDEPKYNETTISGTLKGFYGQTLYLDNNTYNVTWINSDYLENFLGENITIVLKYLENNQDIYIYVGAYLNN